MYEKDEAMHLGLLRGVHVVLYVDLVFVIESESSITLSFPGTNVPWHFCSGKYKFYR